MKKRKAKKHPKALPVPAQPTTVSDPFQLTVRHFRCNGRTITAIGVTDEQMELSKLASDEFERARLDSSTPPDKLARLRNRAMNLMISSIPEGL